jgi:tRNA G10  N-methylase Trm11
MEKFRGKTVIIQRSNQWNLIDETNKYSGKQRRECKSVTGKKCTLYPFPVGMKVLSMFKPKKWLDPCAGWGDRLRCAIAYGCEYVGVDTNKDMESAYQHIIDDLGDPKKVKVKIARFQNVRIDDKFDLIFTSPPFYTKEVYAHMKIWETVDEFMTEFMKPLLRKSYRLLEDKGHLVLYIEDKGVDEFIPAMKDYAETVGLKYEGAFYYMGSSPRPYYVWVK